MPGLRRRRLQRQVRKRQLTRDSQGNALGVSYYGVEKQLALCQSFVEISRYRSLT